jgi:hypothetical protein
MNQHTPFVPHSDFQADPENMMCGATGGEMEYELASYAHQDLPASTEGSQGSDEMWVEEWERQYVGNVESSTFYTKVSNALQDFLTSTEETQVNDQMWIEEWEEQYVDKVENPTFSADDTVVGPQSFMCDDMLTNSDGFNELMEVESEFHPKPVAEIQVHPPTQSLCNGVDQTPSEIDPCIVEAFSDDNLKQDLLRCPPFPEPDKHYPDDRIHFLAAELARRIRFTKLAKRWFKMRINDWAREVSMLVDAIAEPDKDLHPWKPLAEVLDEAVEVLENEYPAEAEWKGFKIQTWRTNAKRRLVSRMRQMHLEIDQIKDELRDLMQNRHGLRYHNAIKLVNETIKEDCENRGSLLLGTIVDKRATSRLQFSVRWSWTD